MSIRFILKRRTYDGCEFMSEGYETIDCEAPALESSLNRGGYGSGPNNDGYDVTEVIGVEVRGQK